MNSTTGSILFAFLLFPTVLWAQEIGKSVSPRAPLKVRIVFEDPKVVQNPPCTGNCPTVGNIGPCTNSNCFAEQNTTPTTTTTQAPIIVRNAPLNLPTFKVIRIPSYTPSFSPNWFPRPRPFFFAPPTSCNGCALPPPPPIRQFRFFSPPSTNANRNMAIPDTIFKNGMAIKPSVRVPESYQDGNPVFNIGK